MTKQATSIIVRELPKSGTLETCNLYIKNATVFYAAVHEPKKKYQAEEKEFSLTAFVDEDTKDKLLDEVMVNKTFALVGKDKTSKPPRRIKYPLSSQVEEGKVNYDVVDGMYGFSLAKPEFSKKGNKMSVNVIDVDGNTFTENVGNGSVCTLKLFAYRNQDNQLVVTLDTVQVLEHIPYEAKASADSVDDDILGVSYRVKKADTKVETGFVGEQVDSAAKAATEPGFDEETLPF
jgi:hypothetical protein